MSGATILGTGDICIVLNLQDLLKSAHTRSHSIASAQPHQLTPVKSTVLLLEDSIVTRIQDKRILEAAGHQVITTVNGLDGLNKLRSHSVAFSRCSCYRHANAEFR